MAEIILLDTGPLGLITQDPRRPAAIDAMATVRRLQNMGFLFAVPEIADYELRRELIRSGATAGLRRLDIFEQVTRYLPITSDVMRQAAWLWAHVRNAGTPTAPREALDGDAILAAQSILAGETGDVVLIATTNLNHFSRFPGVGAFDW